MSRVRPDHTPQYEQGTARSHTTYEQGTIRSHTTVTHRSNEQGTTRSHTTVWTGYGQITHTVWAGYDQITHHSHTPQYEQGTIRSHTTVWAGYGQITHHSMSMVRSDHTPQYEQGTARSHTTVWAWYDQITHHSMSRVRPDHTPQYTKKILQVYGKNWNNFTVGETCGMRQALLTCKWMAPGRSRKKKENYSRTVSEQCTKIWRALSGLVKRPNKVLELVWRCCLVQCFVWIGQANVIWTS